MHGPLGEDAANHEGDAYNVSLLVEAIGTDIATAPLTPLAVPLTEGEATQGFNQQAGEYVLYVNARGFDWTAKVLELR